METEVKKAAPKKAVKKKKSNILYKKTKSGKHVSGVINFARIFGLPIYWFFKPFRFYGPRKVKDGACLYVCNHYTMFDAAYPICTTWEGVHYIAKKEVFETPIVRSVFRGIKAICVNRDGNDVRGMLDAFKCLKNNEKVAIFPEGTRNKTDAEMLPFKSGASMMAIRTKTPIIPIMMYNRPKFFRVTHVLIGEPIELTEYYDKKLTDQDYAEADEKLRNHMLEMRAQHKAYLESKKRKK